MAILASLPDLRRLVPAAAACAFALASPVRAAPARPMFTPDSRAAVVQAANRLIGKPYVWDGKKPSGFDCSGFIYYVMHDVIRAPTFPVKRVNAIDYRNDLAALGDRARTDCGSSHPGDIIYFPHTKYDRYNHIGFITDSRSGMFISAQNRAVGVVPMSYLDPRQWGGRPVECYENVWAFR